MKVALVHDYLKEIGGAERVLMAFKEIWPDAPVYTSYAFPKYWGSYKELFKKWDIRQSWGKWLPLKEKFLSYYTIISPYFFSRMDLSDYDVVIVSQTGAYFPNRVKLGPNTKLITYCHTPPRFLYGYPTASQARYKWYWRAQSEISNHFLRIADYFAAQRPHLFVANSINVKRRIWKFYRRESEVVYPPIEASHPKSLSLDLTPTPLLKQGEGDFKDYYVMVSRIVGSKNIDLAIRAAEKYGFKLRIAGRPVGKYGQEVIQLIKQSKNCEYLGEVGEEEKGKLISGAMAVLTLEEEPDFGIVAIEPQMYGTPVIAYKNGGYLESVQEGKTGVFIEELTAEAINKAVKEVSKLKISNAEIAKLSTKFSKERFKKEMLQLVLKYARTSGNRDSKTTT